MYNLTAIKELLIRSLEFLIPILNINLPVDTFDPINYYLIFSPKSF